ncbi:L-rhamnose mutarotase [Lentzea sp. NPDC051208]|uniref:L-rhamnose mutarotase n=1 Tax=Lentzea sp. NPDC051208 TaxID=3154642 RepID=UPI0034178EFB
MVIRLRPERREEYLRPHSAVWPAVERTLLDANMRNFTVFREVPGAARASSRRAHAVRRRRSPCRRDRCRAVASAGTVSRHTTSCQQSYDD